ncbi:MAG: nitrilase-related carbon-nitrogen hydrolase [Anaerolineae bacterium]
MHIGLAQISMILGAVETNLEKHMAYIEQARRDAVDLLIFPELSLTGYYLQDLNQQVATHPTPDDPVFKPLLQASHDLDLVVGFVEEDRRHRFYIASAYLSRGKVAHVHRKVYLPTYGLFDDARYFAHGSDFRAFDTRFGRVGMLICEDFWHVSPPYLLWLDGADILIATSASPGRGVKGERLATARWVESLLQAYAGVFTNYVLHASRVGIEDGLVYWGGSMAYGPDGELIGQLPHYEEGLLTASIDLNRLRQVRSRLPMLRDERPELTQRVLRRILEDPHDR